MIKNQLRFPPGSIAIFLIAAYPAFVFIFQHVRFYNYDQGFDFSIYAQIVDHFSKTGILGTSLLEPRWINFLTHHLSPYLYLPGMLASGLLSPHNSLFVLQLLSNIISLYGLYLLSRELPFNKIAPLALFCLNPAIFSQNLSDIHDEMYAIPFIIFAYTGMLLKRDWMFFISILALGTIKETFLLVAACFGILRLAYQANLRIKLTTCALIVSFLLIFILYTSILPGRLFWPTFSMSQRIASFSQMMDPELINKKLNWFFYLLLPFVPLVAFNFNNFFSKKAVGNLLLLLPITPLIASVIVTSFDSMLIPFYYYAVIPSVILVVLMLPVIGTSRKNTLPVFLSAFIAVALMPEVNILNQLRATLRKEDPALPLKRIVNQDSTIIVGEDVAAIFTSAKRPIRLRVANKNKINFDYIVRRATDQEQIAGYLEKTAKICYQDKQWQIWCRIR